MLPAESGHDIENLLDELIGDFGVKQVIPNGVSGRDFPVYGDFNILFHEADSAVPFAVGRRQTFFAGADFGIGVMGAHVCLGGRPAVIAAWRNPTASLDEPESDVPVFAFVDVFLCNHD